MRLLILPVFAVFFSCLSCSNQSGFQGGAARSKQPLEPAQSAEEDPDAKLPATPASIPAIEPAPVMPENAVTKGSFTAWAEPPRPSPHQAYWIFIEVRLPTTATSYQLNDLSGRLVGTDGYTRGVGRDSRGALDGAAAPPPWSGVGAIPQDQFQVNGRTARIAVWVPGAEELVRDTVNIRSDVLNENQSLEIVFQ